MLVDPLKTKKNSLEHLSVASQPSFHQEKTKNNHTTASYLSTDILVSPTTYEVTDDEAGYFESFTNWVSSFFDSDEDQNSPSVTHYLESFSQWIWADIFGYQTPEKPALRLTRKQQTELSQFISTMQEILQKAQEIKEQEQDIDKIFERIHRQTMIARSDQAKFSKEMMLISHEEKKRLHALRSAEMNEILKRAEKNELFGLFENLATTFQLAAIGISLGTGVGTLLLLYSIGQSVDTLLGDPAKKMLAKTLVKEESQDQFLLRLKFGLAAFSTISSLYLSGIGGIATAINVATGTTKGIKGYYDYEVSKDKGKLYDMDNKIQHTLSETNKNLDQLRAIVKMICNQYNHLAEAQQNRRQLLKSILKAI